MIIIANKQCMVEGAGRREGVGGFRSVAAALHSRGANQIANQCHGVRFSICCFLSSLSPLPHPLYGLVRSYDWLAVNIVTIFKLYLPSGHYLCCVASTHKHTS